MGMRRPTAVLLISLTLLSVAGTLALMPQSALARGLSLSGWLHVIWADLPPGSNGEPGPRYVLIDDQDRWTEVVLDEDRVGPLGGPLAFNRLRMPPMGASGCIRFRITKTSWVESRLRASMWRRRAVTKPLPLSASPNRRPTATI